MMGFKERAFAPLVAVSLEALVPQDHFYRHLQTVLDLSFVYDLVRECYAGAGRPSIDPVVFWHRCNWSCFLKISAPSACSCARWRIGSACAGISAMIWMNRFPSIPLEAAIRQRYGLEVFRRFFEAIVQRCHEAHLVWGRELYFDSSAGSTPMRIWIPLSRVLRWRREKRSKNI
jgi:transposase